MKGRNLPKSLKARWLQRSIANHRSASQVSPTAGAMIDGSATPQTPARDKPDLGLSLTCGIERLRMSCDGPPYSVSRCSVHATIAFCPLLVESPASRSGVRGFASDSVYEGRLDFVIEGWRSILIVGWRRHFIIGWRRDFIVISRWRHVRKIVRRFARGGIRSFLDTLGVNPVTIGVGIAETWRRCTTATCLVAEEPAQTAFAAPVSSTDSGRIDTGRIQFVDELGTAVFCGMFVVNQITIWLIQRGALAARLQKQEHTAGQYPYG